MGKIMHSCQHRNTTLGPPPAELLRRRTKTFPIGCGEHRIRQSAGPAGDGGGMTPLDRTKPGTDFSMATINDDPFTLTALIFDAQVQLPIHQIAAAEQITANWTHTEARCCLGRGDAHYPGSDDNQTGNHDSQQLGSLLGGAQGLASKVAGGTGASRELAPGVESAPSSGSSCGWNHSHTWRARAGPSPGAWARVSGLASWMASTEWKWAKILDPFRAKAGDVAKA